jgi:hypothetical protein
MDAENEKSRMMETIRRKAAAVGAALMSTLVSLVVIEAGLRLCDGVPLLTLKNFVGDHIDLPNSQPVNQYDPVVGWVLKPDLRVKYDNPAHVRVTLTSGDFGIRMNQTEILPVPRGGTLVSGDSFAAGSDVADAETWPAHLQQRLNRPVINAAAGGWGIDQIILRAETLTPILKPKTIIIAFTPDAVDRNGYLVFGGGSKPWFTIENGDLALHNQPVERLANNPRNLGFWRGTLGYSHLVNTLVSATSYRREWWDTQLYVKYTVDVEDLSCRLLKRMQKFTAERGISYLILIQFNGGHLTASHEPQHAVAAAKCARDAGIALVDAWDPLKAVLSEKGVDALKELHVMHDAGRVYGHMSSGGNYFIASLLQDRLLSARSAAEVH